jgi:hypothetical protein
MYLESDLEVTEVPDIGFSIEGMWRRGNKDDEMPRGWRYLEEFVQVECWYYKPAKVVYLDIDEVFTAEPGKNCSPVDHDAMRLIRDLCLEYGWKVVLSSIWQCQKVTDNTKLLEAFGFPKKAIYHDSYTDGSGSGFRGKAIEAHQLRNNDIVDYILVDDSSDFYLDQMEHLIHIHALSGFGHLEALYMRNRMEEEKKYYEEASEYPFTPIGGIGPTEPHSWAIRVFIRNHVAAYVSRNCDAEGQLILLDDDATVVMMTKKRASNEPLVVAGQGTNARVLSTPELASFAGRYISMGHTRSNGILAHSKLHGEMEGEKKC